jgi:hypothetical protein
MTKRGARIKHPKRRGEWAELCFMLRAAEQGLELSKPCSETAPYDFVVESAGRFLRIQVKSTTFRLGGDYICNVAHHNTPYEDGAFDIVAACLIPIDLWYIIPEKIIRGQKSIALHPKWSHAKYELYREAWHLLGGKASRTERVHSIKACAEDFSPQFPVLSANFSTETSSPAIGFASPDT